MDFETAMESTVSRSEAIAEIAAHGFDADYDVATGELFECSTGETIAMPNADGDYAGSDVLGWLGY